MLKRMAPVIVAFFACATAWPAGETAGKGGQLRTYELDIFGPSIEAAMKQAGLHTVRSAVGEFYCSDEMLLARSLLDLYLERYYQRFIASQKILSRRESQGMVYLRTSFVVDVDALEDDLRQKRFFYKPRRRPFVYVTVAETVDGTPTAGEPISRQAVHTTLSRLLMRFEPRVIYSKAPNIDLTQDIQHLEGAREAAQRAGAEVLLTGHVDLNVAREKKIHFDQYTFYNARARLVLIRVDDGQVLESGTYEASAGNADRQAARQEAASRATSKILEDVMPRFAVQWERTMTDNVELQVVVVGVSTAEAAIVQERLETRLKGVEVSRRSLFEDVAVFNLYYLPDQLRPGESKRVEQVLRDMVSPRFKIVPAKKEKQVCAKRVS